MAIWLIFAVMTAIVLAILFRSLANAGATEQSETPPDAAIYKDQLEEIEADVARGLISEAEAEGARIEVARRLLAAEASSSPSETVSESGRSDSLAPLPPNTQYYLSLGIVGVALAFYLTFGSPWLSGQPYASRIAEQTKQQSPRIGQLISAVERRLRKNPQDARGWDVIAPVYLRIGRFGDAERAFETVIRLNGETPKRLAGLAHAKVMAANGVVTADARTAYERLLKLRPNAPEPIFWIAVSKEQDGNLLDAYKDYARLLKEAPASAPWRKLVEQRLAIAGKKLGRPEKIEPPPGPTAEDVAAAKKMVPSERMAMIRQMVDGLAARLAENGKDLEGWKRLIRSYAVLGEKRKASSALDDARAALGEDSQAVASLNAFAKKLSVQSGTGK